MGYLLIRIFIETGGYVGNVYRSLRLQNLHNDVRLSSTLEALGAKWVSTYNVEVSSRRNAIFEAINNNWYRNGQHRPEGKPLWEPLHRHFLYEDPTVDVRAHVYACKTLRKLDFLDVGRFSRFPGTLQVNLNSSNFTCYPNL